MSALENVSADRVELTDLLAQSPTELLALAERLGVGLRPHLPHDEVAKALVEHHIECGTHVYAEGILTLLPEGFGFVRMTAYDFDQSAVDVYVSPGQVRNLNLQEGHHLRGPMRGPRGTERFFALLRIEELQGRTCDNLQPEPPFASRTAVVATRQLCLPPIDDEARALTALSPWCYGHRVLVTAPATWPRAMLLARIAAGVRTADQRARIVVCLLEQRPEDVAAARSLLQGHGVQVTATAFAAWPQRHLDVAAMTLAAATREAERSRDVVLMLDSLTALVRAAGRTGAPSGAWAHPGIDTQALQLGKQLFASARQCAEGGSLTVIATASLDPASSNDAAICREFAVAANSEVVIDHDLADRAIELPLDVLRTRTRPEDDPRPPAERDRWQQLRAELTALGPEQRRQRWLHALRG